MSLTSIFFIFFFLPVTVIFGRLLPGLIGNIFLLAASIVFYAWGDPAYIAVLVISIFFNYAAGVEMQLAIEGSQRAGAKRMLIIGIIFNVFVLGFFKYYGFLIDNINGLFGTDITAKQLPLPLGISFFTFSALSYLIDVYRQDEEAEFNVINFSLYIAFFAKITQGPIVRYADMAKQFYKKDLSRKELGAGLAMFVRGLGKKILLADSFGMCLSSINTLPESDMTVALAWLRCLIFTLQIYFDFSGYSDMAIGIGRMLGFSITKNFDYPYVSESVSEFWRRWHMTLGAWFREYIYIPLGGNRTGIAKNIRNIMIVWLLTGIWHGAAWTYIVWGIYYGLVLLVEKFLLSSLLKKVPVPVRRIYTMFFVMLGWAIFMAPSLMDAMGSIVHMFRVTDAGFFGRAFWYYLKSSIIQIIVGCMMCSPAFFRNYKKMVFAKKSRARIYVSCLLYVGIFICSLAYIIGSTYQSFLYVQF